MLERKIILTGKPEDIFYKEYVFFIYFKNSINNNYRKYINTIKN